jgi:hypothetical protein
MENAEPTVSTEFSASTATKSAIQLGHGGTLALAIAMEENASLACTYPFGDQTPDGQPKIGDAANFGVYKMNWYMIRQCSSGIQLIGIQTASVAWQAAGQAINASAPLATQILLEAMQKWSVDAPDPAAPVAGNFWAGHRGGQSGLQNLPGAKWQDIQDYYLAIQAIKAKCDLDATVWTTNVRYGVALAPV